MNIAYVCFVDAYREDGVVKKIRDQVTSWSQLGHTAQVFCLTPSSSGRAPALAGELFEFSTLLERIRTTRRLSGAVQAFGADVVYLRFDLFLPPLLWHALEDRAVVVELNGHWDEYRFRGASARAYQRWARPRLLRRADGFVCVAAALARDPIVQRPTNEIAVIGNGIDVDRLPSLPAPRNARARGVFLGSAGLPWHGVDKLRALAEHLPEVDLDVVGPSAADLGAPVPTNVRVHGYLPRERYENILACADFGIGSLAMHRQGLDEASPLKLREYIAYGLPVVVAHQDPDLTSEPHWFVLELPNREDNVADSAGALRAWIPSVQGRRVDKDTAGALVGSTQKEARRIELMERVVEATRVSSGRGRSVRGSTPADRRGQA